MSRFEDQHNRDAGREPCPDRIVEDLGSAFGMGCIGGFIWHFVKGCRNTPKGERIAGGLYHGRIRGPILGGNFAMWGGTFSAFDCTLQYIRKTDDHWNNIASGFLTGGVLAARAGWKQAGKNAVMGGVILAVIEGVAALIMRSQARTPKEMALEQLEMEKQQREWEQMKAKKEGGSSMMEGGVFNSFIKNLQEFGQGGNKTAMIDTSGSNSTGDMNMGLTSSKDNSDSLRNGGGFSVSGDLGFAGSGGSFSNGGSFSSTSISTTSGGFSSDGGGGLLPEGGLIPEGKGDIIGGSKASSWF